MTEVIPYVCNNYPNVHWIIGGDGPKRVDLEEVREKHQLHDRIEMLGSVPHSEVRNVSAILFSFFLDFYGGKTAAWLP